MRGQCRPLGRRRCAATRTAGQRGAASPMPMYGACRVEGWRRHRKELHRFADVGLRFKLYLHWSVFASPLICFPFCSFSAFVSSMIYFRFTTARPNIYNASFVRKQPFTPPHVHPKVFQTRFHRCVDPLDCHHAESPSLLPVTRVVACMLFLPRVDCPDRLLYALGFCAPCVVQIFAPQALKPAHCLEVRTRDSALEG